MVVVNDKFSEFKQNWYLQQLINTTNKIVIKMVFNTATSKASDV